MLTSMLIILWYLAPCVFINLCLCKSGFGQGHGCAKAAKMRHEVDPRFYPSKNRVSSQDLQNRSRYLSDSVENVQKPFGIRPKTLANNHG